MGIAFRPLLWRPLVLFTFFNSSFIFFILSLILLLSTSSFVSPGPLVPIPPPNLDRAKPLPTSLGRRYCNCASSTWSLPSFVLALWAKISRISSVRSSTLTPITFSKFLTWAGVRSSSEITVSIPSARQRPLSSSALPLPIRYAASYLSFSCITLWTTSAPAVSARRASSSRCSSTLHL